MYKRIFRTIKYIIIKELGERSPSSSIYIIYQLSLFMNLSSIKYYSTQNGPGFRTAIFVSGCRIHCEGCFNKIAWDFKCGKEITDEIFSLELDILLRG